jgi:hypothetical protein
MQPTSIPISVSSHALERIAERSGQRLSAGHVKRIVSDPRARLDHVSGAAGLYAGPGIVLVVRHRRGLRMVVTALSPEMVEQNLMEDCLQGVGQRCAPRNRNWCSEVVRAKNWCSDLRRRTSVATPSVSKAPSIPRSEEAPVSVLTERTFEGVVAGSLEPEVLRVELTKESISFCREVRRRLGLSQQELADRVGVLRATIKRIECAQLKSLPASVAMRLHEALVEGKQLAA